MNAFRGVEFLPIPPMASPLSVVDVFFPGFSAVTASAQQLLVNDVNGYVRLLCMGAVLVVFARYVYGYANELINNYFSPTVHIYYYDEVYEMVTHWIRAQSFFKEAHSLRVRVKNQQRTLVQDQLLEKKPLAYSPWEGSFPFWYKNHRLRLHCQFRDHREEISISCVGTSSDILFDLLEECRTQYLQLTRQKVSVFQPDGGEWKRTSLKRARDLSTVIMDEQVKTALLNDIEAFLNEQNQEWYANRGIPYKRGYLLEGPPGTGKSSLCLSIAGLKELDVYAPSLSTLTDDGLSKLFAQLPSECVVLLEDVDAVGLKRKGVPKDPKQDTPRSKVSLSGLLNVIDGVGSQEGRILIMTTNHIEDLDEALIRSGRVDKIVSFKRASKDIAARLFRSVFQERSRKQEQPDQTDEDRAVDQLADEFAAHIPEEQFSPAKILEYLVGHKDSATVAVEGAAAWVTRQTRVKQPETKLERETSWLTDN